MQIIAMLTMLVDHIGAVFYPDMLPWRIIGRIAFPIYAYLIVVGYRRTSDLKRYTLRLLALAAVSQIPFMLAFQTTGINVIGTLFVCILVLYGLDHWSKTLSIPATIVLSAFMELLDFDYGIYGLLLVLIYRYMSGHAMIGSHLALNLLFVVIKRWDVQIFSLLTTMGIVYFPQVYRYLERRMVPN
ncbi:TraX family protein [Paenibacillus caui]|uniref:TraX family protein n=1 Tax=Paenibacillus caui TaxID=2873927 RepID=UPI001CA7E7EA|nr:TraX family protein [Paenibacillus caui]